MKNWEQDVKKVLFHQEEIAIRIKELAGAINEYYGDKELVLVGILKGSAIFFADLARELSCPVMFDFMCVSSYGSSAVSSGMVDIKKDLTTDIAGKNVLLIEDILDTGNTLHELLPILSERKPASLKLCCFLNKPDRRQKPIQADFTGFYIPDEFVVGYGLDYNENYRNLPYVGILKRNVYEDCE